MYVRMCMCVCVQLCMYVCVHVYIYIYIIFARRLPKLFNFLPEGLCHKLMGELHFQETSIFTGRVNGRLHFQNSFYLCQRADGKATIRRIIYLPEGTGCSEKIVFFHSSLQPVPRLHITVRDLHSSQRSASVQSLLLAGLFCTTNSG